MKTMNKLKKEMVEGMVIGEEKIFAHEFVA
jgi:hypothetical protein